VGSVKSTVNAEQHWCGNRTTLRLEERLAGIGGLCRYYLMRRYFTLIAITENAAVESCNTRSK
jgi:hypothetical protein